MIHKYQKTTTLGHDPVSSCPAGTKDDKNKICKHAKIDRHLIEFAAANFYM